jgi:hypothetical protein
MADRLTIDQLPDAPGEAIAIGSMIIADPNGVEYRASISALGGVHVFFLEEDDRTPFVRFRLISPGRTVESVPATLTVTAANGTVVSRSTTTDALGNGEYDFTGILARGQTYTVEVRIAVYLTATMQKTISALSVPIDAVTATSTAKVGDTITLTPPNFDGSPTGYRYRYLRGTAYVIPGAEGLSYTLQPDDDGDVITAQVQPTNAGGDGPWYSANGIGPVSNKTSVLLSSPVIAGSTEPGSRMTVTSSGAASENAIIKSDEWQIDQAKIPALKAPLTRYLAAATAVAAPTGYPDGNNHHGVGLSTAAYGGTNTYSFSVAASATENDYIATQIGAAGGNEGAQVYDLFMRHLNTNSSIRIRMYAAKYRGGVLIEEVQMPKVGVTAGTELGELGVTTNATSHWTLTHDFGEWLDGDWLVFRQQARNISAAGANSYQWDARGGLSYATLPIGNVQDLQKTLSVFTTRADMATKKVRLARTFSNRNNDVVAYSNEITLAAAAVQSVTPANTTAPTIVASSDRSNTTWQIDLGAWANQPTGYTVQWTDNGVDIAGATLMSYKPTSAQEGHTIACRVTATNAINSTSITTAGKVVLPAAAFWNPATGNDGNDGLTAEFAKQTLVGTDTIPSGATAVLSGVFGTRLKVGSNRNYEGLGADLTAIGSTSVSYAIDHYTDDGSLGRSNVKISKMRITSGDRAIMARQGANWVIEDVVIDQAGFNPVGSSENASGIYFYRNNGITLRRVSLLQVMSDGLYSDTNDKITIEDCLFRPVMTAEGDTIQTRADRNASDGSPGPHQKGYLMRGTFLDMHSIKTSSGKGCLVTNMHDYILIHDNILDGNNFVHGTDEGDNQVFCRNVSRYSRKNSYSFGYGIGGYDNQPGSHNHQLYDNSWYDMNRALSFTGISVTGYTGTKSGRVDIVAHDETVIKCANGVRVDRPTSGRFRGFVFHNVTKPLDRTLTTLPAGGEIQAFIWDSHFTYNGSIAEPPKVVARAQITGSRVSGAVLSGPDSGFDAAAVLTAFPTAVITRSYQWRRHKPAVQWANWTGVHLGWLCEWIDGATASSYTITDADQGCLVSRVDRIHLTFTEAGVTKTVTALAYDASYATSSEVLRTGALATPLPALPTAVNLSLAVAETGVVVNFPDQITGETRSLLNTSRAYDPYTGTSVAMNSNGDLIRGAGVLTVNQTFSIKVRQKRGFDIVDTVMTVTVTA